MRRDRWRTIVVVFRYEGRDHTAPMRFTYNPSFETVKAILCKSLRLEPGKAAIVTYESQEG